MNAYKALTYILLPVRPRGLSLSTSGTVKLTWQDNSAIELGFSIEKREGLDDRFIEIARLSPDSSPIVIIQ